MSDFSAFFFSWLTVIGVIWGLFYRLGEVLNKETKDKVSGWLLSEESNWPQTFVSLFDRLFGEKLFSLRRISLSILASILSLAVVLIGWWLIAPKPLESLFSTYEIWEVFGIMAMLNVIPDYFSLRETRWLIQRMSKKSGVFMVAMLVLDVMVTFAIFVSFSWIIMKLSGTDRLPDFLEYTSFSLQGLGFKEYIGVFVQTSFFTTVWVWLYVLSGLVIKLIAPLRAWLKIKQKPLQSMGSLLIVLVTLGYLIAGLIVLASS